MEVHLAEEREVLAEVAAEVWQAANHMGYYQGRDSPGITLRPGLTWGIIEASLYLEAGARSQAEEEEDKFHRWMEEELDDKLQEQE